MGEKDENIKAIIAQTIAELHVNNSVQIQKPKTLQGRFQNVSKKISPIKHSNQYFLSKFYLYDNCKTIFQRI